MSYYFDYGVKEPVGDYKEGAVKMNVSRRKMFNEKISTEIERKSAEQEGTRDDTCVDDARERRDNAASF